MLSEEQIIKGCRKFNKIAQQELYKRYAPVMHALCIRYAVNRDEAKDIVQKGFLKIFSRIKQYSGKGSFEGWMKRIIINTAITHFNKNKKHYYHHSIDNYTETHTALSEIEEKEKEVDKHEIDKHNVNFALIEKADFSESEILDALDKLPFEFKAVFSLYCIEKYKHNEIATILKIDKNTSRSRLSRARAILQKELYKMSIKKLGR